jgi:hypothetical protein
VTAQQRPTLQHSVLQAGNAPHVSSGSINFQVRAGIAVPSSVTIASVWPGAEPDDGAGHAQSVEHDRPVSLAERKLVHVQPAERPEHVVGFIDGLRFEQEVTA